MEHSLPKREISGTYCSAAAYYTHHTLYAECLSVEWPFGRKILNNIKYSMITTLEAKSPTDLSSASLFGVGQVLGSRVIVWKRLYVHEPNERAKIICANA